MVLLKQEKAGTMPSIVRSTEVEETLQSVFSPLLYLFQASVLYYGSYGKGKVLVL